ncbi:MAG: hypothetical protein DCF26_09800 [Burkholderiales bacterium]|nr:MAG: hypothetical protein DCF26_09800 [Burkholderiales bacterium]
MGSKKRSKPFQAKWKPSINTIQVAASRVAKLAPDTVRGLAESLGRSMKELTVAERSAYAWQDLRMACVVSRRVERMGVVKGMSDIWEDAFAALERVRERSMVTGVWRYCTPTDAELEMVLEMTKMHSKQLSYLSVGEFEQVFLASRSDLAVLPKIFLPVADDLKAA